MRISIIVKFWKNQKNVETFEKISELAKFLKDYE